MTLACPECDILFEPRSKQQRFCSRPCQIKALRDNSTGRASTLIRLKPELKQRLQEAAEARDVSMNWIAGRAIKEYLDRLLPPELIRWTRDPDD